MGRNEVYARFHPKDCPRNVTVGVAHYPNEASRWYCGPIKGYVRCPILGRTATFDIDLVYDSIVGLTCLSSCSKCPKPKHLRIETTLENEEPISLGFDVTAEFAKVASKKPSNT